MPAGGLCHAEKRCASVIASAKLKLLLFASALSSAAFGQYDGTGDVYVGRWTGIITQETPETTRYFDIEMTLSPAEGQDSVYAVSSHVADGEYHAYMVGRAFRSADGRLFIAESEIVRSDSIPGMEWCVKRMELQTEGAESDEVHLRGQWAGDTTFGPCQPGDMDLVRAVVRP